MDGKLPPLVLIEWEDSAQAAPQWQWLSAVEPPPIVKCQSVGFLIRNTPQEKALAISLGGDGDDMQASGIIAIPARAVVRMVELVSGAPFEEAEIARRRAAILKQMNGFAGMVEVPRPDGTVEVWDFRRPA